MKPSGKEMCAGAGGQASLPGNGEDGEGVSAPCVQLVLSQQFLEGSKAIRAELASL